MRIMCPQPCSMKLKLTYGSKIKSEVKVPQILPSSKSPLSAHKSPIMGPPPPASPNYIKDQTTFIILLKSLGYKKLPTQLNTELKTFCMHVQRDKGTHKIGPLPPKMSMRFSTMVALWPQRGAGDGPDKGSSLHSSDTADRGNL